MREWVPVWTLVVVMLVLLAGGTITSPVTMTGEDLKFDTGKTITITGKSLVMAEFGSSQAFMLINGMNTPVYGSPAEPPIGWRYKEYYKSPKSELGLGSWRFAAGAASVHITSETPAQVKLTETYPAMVWLGLVILGFFVWGVFIFLFS